MDRPEDIPQDVWRTAETAAKEATRDAMRDPLMPYYITVTPHIARALLKASEEALEECAAYIEGKGGVISGATVYAKVVSRNEMPSMSGDDRDRLNQWDRRAFDRATEDLCRAIRCLPQKRNKP